MIQGFTGILKSLFIKKYKYITLIMVKVLYNGTFDPVTKGHEDLVYRASELFEKVVIGIFDTPAKSLLFTTAERVELFIKSTKNLKNVEVLPYRGLSVNFAESISAKAIVRGVRSITDADYEATMTMMNRKLKPKLDTVLLYTSMEYQFVSSTLIKEVAKYGGDVSEFVSEHVANAIKMKYATIN
jgi:pantetheine-phosphate adenylyltransferase